MAKAVVLVVEDEVLIRMGAVHIVEDAGFAAVEAGDADQAIGILEARDDIRAVFTDVNMPGSLDGWKLARAIRRRWPPIHLIVTSGLSVPNGDLLPTGARFVRKPYTALQVAAALRDLFSSSPAPGPLTNDNDHNYGKAA